MWAFYRPPWEQQLVGCLASYPQATANLIEDSVWDGAQQIPELEGLPFVDIYTESGQYVASTLDLPHRLGTGYLLKNKYTKLDGQRFREGLRQRIRDKEFIRLSLRSAMSIVLGSFTPTLPEFIGFPVFHPVSSWQKMLSPWQGGAVHDPVSARGQGINSTSLPLRRKSARIKLCGQ